VGSLKEDVTNIKQDLIHMNADVGSLKQDVTNIKDELNCFKVRLENMDNSLIHIDSNMSKMREMLASSSFKRKSVGSSAIGTVASTAGNQCASNMVVPEELKLILNMGVDGIIKLTLFSLQNLLKAPRNNATRSTRSLICLSSSRVSCATM
jgi:hypothetical protein